MTDPTDVRAKYELVPGITAYQLLRVMNRVITGFGIVALVAIAIFLWNEFMSSGGPDPVSLAVTYGFVFVPTMVGIGFGFAVKRRSRVETAAGYTTRTTGFQNLDQVDPRTGVVIRRAGSAVLTVPSRRGEAAPAPNGAVLNASSFDEVRFVEDASASRRRTLGFVGVLVIGAVVVAVRFIGLLNSGGPGIVELTLGICVALIVVTVGVVGAVARSKLQAVARRRPNAGVFMSSRTPELVSALARIGIQHSVIGRQTAISVGAAGLETWGTTGSDTPSVVFGWSEVDHVHPGKLLVKSGNSARVVLTLHVFREVNGEQLDFPLPLYGRRGIAFARPTAGNRVLDAFRPYVRVS